MVYKEIGTVVAGSNHTSSELLFLNDNFYLGRVEYKNAAGSKMTGSEMLLGHPPSFLVYCFTATVISCTSDRVLNIRAHQIDRLQSKRCVRRRVFQTVEKFSNARVRCFPCWGFPVKLDIVLSCLEFVDHTFGRVPVFLFTRRSSDTNKA